MAWWHAVAKPPPSRQQERAPRGEQLPAKSRLALRREAGGQPDLPDIEPELEYLVGYLFDAGPVSVVGMGPQPLTWTDLDAWQRCSGVVLQPWQSELLRHLSGQYLAESQIADAHDAPPPWERDMADRRKTIAKHIKQLLRG